MSTLTPKSAGPRTALAALACFVVTHVAWGQTFGAAPIDRPVADGATHITFISGHAAPTSGTVSQWQLWANGTGDLSLQIWRPVSGGFTLVGKEDVTVASLGLNTFTPGTAGIQVEAGDLLGFRYGASTGIVAASFESSSWKWTNWPWPGGDVPVGGFMSSDSLVSPGPQREYSLQATVAAVPEPATLASLGLGALALLRRRSRWR